MNIFKLLGEFLGLRRTTEEPVEVPVKKKQPTSVSGSKTHLVELFKQEIKENKPIKIDINSDGDLLVLISYMVSNRIII